MGNILNAVIGTRKYINADLILRTFILTIGAAIAAIGVEFFLVPNKIIDGGNATGGRIIPAGNGNYRFHYNDLDLATYESQNYVYEINTAGEFLKIDSVDFVDFRHA